MFSVRPNNYCPGFRVAMPEDPPGFRVDEDGSVRTAGPADTGPAFAEVGGNPFNGVDVQGLNANRERSTECSTRHGAQNVSPYAASSV
jgi:hypothetical protein